MSDKTKSLRTQIANDIAKIDGKKHFGTKMPDNPNKEQKQTEEELKYLQMTMGSLASMIWGVKNKNKNQDVRTL